jgi:transcription elongation factor Elf1
MYPASFSASNTKMKNSRTSQRYTKKFDNRGCGAMSINSKLTKIDTVIGRVISKAMELVVTFEVCAITALHNYLCKLCYL